MKFTTLVTGGVITLLNIGSANEEKNLTSILSEEITERQDELSADAQELIEIQTQEGVIQKLEEMENTMLEATLKLLNNDTGGETIAIQTEIIEKAYEAAKEKQSNQSNQSSTDKALLDALEKMLGKNGESKKKSSKKQAGNSSGEGGEDAKSSASDSQQHSSQRSFNGTSRSVPSVTPTSGELLPLEFQKLVEEYNQLDK